MTILQRELSCHQYLPSYAHFFIQKLPPKMCSKMLTSTHFLEVPSGPTATATPLRPTCNKGSDQTVEKKCQNAASYAAYAAYAT